MKDSEIITVIEQPEEERVLDARSTREKVPVSPGTSSNREVKRAMTEELLAMGLSRDAVARILHLRLRD